MVQSEASLSTICPTAPVSLRPSPILKSQVSTDWPALTGLSKHR